MIGQCLTSQNCDFEKCRKTHNSIHTKPQVVGAGYESLLPLSESSHKLILALAQLLPGLVWFITMCTNY